MLVPRYIASTKMARKDGEYIVRAYDQDGKRWPDCDYFTDDRQDALDTARAMLIIPDHIQDALQANDK
jgi:hypothetical protein